jgi:hypothetical protein
MAFLSCSSVLSVLSVLVVTCAWLPWP